MDAGCCLGCCGLIWITLSATVISLLLSGPRSVCTVHLRNTKVSLHVLNNTIRLSFCLSYCPSMSVSVCSSTSVSHLSVYLGLFIYLSTSSPASLSVCLLSSVCLWYEPTGTLLILFVTHTHTYTHPPTHTRTHYRISSLQTACRQSSVSELSWSGLY